MKTRYIHLPATNPERLLALWARVVEGLCQYPGFVYASPVFADSHTELLACYTGFADDHTEALDSHTRFADGYTEIADAYTKFWDECTENADSHTEFLYNRTAITDGYTKASCSHTFKIYNYLKIVVLYADSSPPALRYLFKRNSFHFH